METLTPAADLKINTLPARDHDSLAGVRPKTRPAGRMRRYLVFGTVALTAILMLMHLAWNQSGSNRWEPAMDEDGVKVWTLKSPGSNLLKVKGTVRVNSTLSGMIRLLEDLESCVDAQCYDGKVLETLETPPGRYAAYLRFKYDIPGLGTQDFVLLQEHYQDPGSKQIEINMIAAPSRIPPDECCVRVTHLHNHWKLTPVANNTVDVEFMQDTDIKGLPYFLMNLVLEQGTHEILHGMQALMNMEKYRTAKVGYIQELASH